MKRGSPLWVALLLAPWLLWGAWSLLRGGGEETPAREVVVYVSLDRLFAQPILERFTQETGIAVRAKYDSEATKTTGLVEALLAERSRPRCDVFWNNEVSQTIRLARADALQPYQSPSASGLPAWAQDPAKLWTGFAARARVLIVNTERVPADQRPSSVEALLDPAWRGQIGIAKPLFGTTATHVAAWFARDGQEQAQAWFDRLKANEVVVCAGNADVKDRVAAGELAFGWTDTDDANLALQAGEPVAVVFPDQGPQGRGTLLIPNALSLMKGAPHTAEGKALIDWLLRPEIEEALAASRSVQIPLRDGLPRAEWIPSALKAEPIDWREAAARFAAARAYVEQRFLAE